MQRRLTVTAPNELLWEEVELAPPGPGEVRVRTLLSAVSVASELSVMRDGPFSTRLGYQTLGVVAALGVDAGIEMGRRVITTLGHASSGLHCAGDVCAIPGHRTHS